MPSKLEPQPTTAQDVRDLMGKEIVKTTPDRFRIQGLTRLLDSFEAQENAAEKSASKLLPTVIAEKDALLAEVSGLREQAAKFATMETEYGELKTNFDARIAAMRTDLVAESQQKLWAAERARNEARNISEDVRAKFDKAGLQLLLDFVQKLVEQFSIPEPDPSTLPKNVSSLILTCWGYTPTRATLMLAYARSFPEPNQAFRQTLLRYLKETLPLQSFAGAELPKPTENLADKIAVLTAMAKRWDGVWPDIQREFEQLQIERQAAFLKNHNAQMAAQEHEDAARGMGRTPISVAEPASITGCPPGEPHLAGCVCCACGGNGSVESNWSGFIPASPEIGTALPTKQEDNER
jgi:hypothetical protein